MVAHISFVVMQEKVSPSVHGTSEDERHDRRTLPFLKLLILLPLLADGDTSVGFRPWWVVVYFAD
jgi:hypothetical protein